MGLAQANMVARDKPLIGTSPAAPLRTAVSFCPADLESKMSRKPFGLFVRTESTSPVAWKQNPAKKITLGSRNSLTRSAAPSSNSNHRKRILPIYELHP